MSHSRWSRHASEDAAVDKLLDAAGRAFAEVGVGKATMVDVARAAGCSRATLYRYFPNQEALHLAYVHRATLRIARQLADERHAGAPEHARLTESWRGSPRCAPTRCSPSGSSPRTWPFPSP